MAHMQAGVNDPSEAWASRQQMLTLGLLYCKVTRQERPFDLKGKVLSPNKYFIHLPPVS